jgi:hypothetical protein
MLSNDAMGATPRVEPRPVRDPKDFVPAFNVSAIRRLASNRVSSYNVIIRSFLAMKTRVVRIGNARGIRIPKVLLEKWEW